MTVNTCPRRVGALLGVMVAGLIFPPLIAGQSGNFIGAVLYAVLICLLLLFFRPQEQSGRQELAAFTFCLAVELFQLTGFPQAWERSVPWVHLVLGAGFEWIDIAAYLVGALGVFLLRRVRCTLD